MDNKMTMKDAAPIVLRIALSLVFLWFASQQFIYTEMWTRLIPTWLTDMTGLGAETFVHFNAAFEVVFGLSLLAGFFTRTSALLLALHLLSIVIDLGYNAIAVRDVGLMLAMVAIFLYGVDRWCLDWRLEKKQVQ